MSDSKLWGVGGVYGIIHEPAISISTAGAITGQWDIPASSFVGGKEEGLLFASFGPSPITSTILASAPVITWELYSIGLALLQVDIVDFPTGGVGQYQEGYNPRRKYGSIGLWSNDSFLGWRELSRTRNRFHFASSSEGALPFVISAISAGVFYSYWTSVPLADYRQRFINYVLEEGVVRESTINRVSWALSPGVTISLHGHNACSGTIVGYLN
jgi:hypothetical protein